MYIPRFLSDFVSFDDGGRGRDGRFGEKLRYFRDSEFELELVALLAQQRRSSAESDFGLSRPITKLFKLPLPPSLRLQVPQMRERRKAVPGW